MPRKHFLKSAEYWFEASKDAARQGRRADAGLAMENAYNHVENALIAHNEVLKEASEILTEMGWHKDRGLLQRIIHVLENCK